MPDFSLPGSDGKIHTLRDYAGRTLVVYFYPKDNTPGCTSEACGFRDLSGELQGISAALVGVSRDSFASHDKFGLPFTLLSDPDGTVVKHWPAVKKAEAHPQEMLAFLRTR